MYDHLMSPLDYAAGFFDGDGSVWSIPNPNHGKWLKWNLAFTNTDYRVLEAMKNILEIRNTIEVRIRNPRLPHHNLKLPIYNLRMAAQSDVLRVAKLLVDRCIIKRSRLQDAINDLEKKEMNQSDLFKAMFLEGE